MAATCSNIPPVGADETKCEISSHYFNGAYIGRLTAISHSNGYLRAMFGKSWITAKIDVLPEWLIDGCVVRLDFENDNISISKYEYDFEHIENMK